MEHRKKAQMRDMTQEQRQIKCLNLVRSFLGQNHIHYTEKHCSTGTSYFYIDIGYDFSIVKIRVSDHESGLILGDEDKGWKSRGYTYEIRSDNKDLINHGNPMSYISQMINNAIRTAKKYATYKYWENVRKELEEKK